MRFSPTLLVVALCAAAAGSAPGQSVTPNPARSSKSLSGFNFAYDGEHGQITASGVQLKPSLAKSDAPPTTTGKIWVTLRIRIASEFTKPTTYHCSVYAIGGIIDTDNGTVDGGIETANGFATVASPSIAYCTLKIPYAWTLPKDPNADSGLILAYGVSAVNVHSEVQRSTLQLDGIENLPGQDTTSKFTFDVTL